MNSGILMMRNIVKKTSMMIESNQAVRTDMTDNET